MKEIIQIETKFVALNLNKSLAYILIHEFTAAPWYLPVIFVFI